MFGPMKNHIYEPNISLISLISLICIIVSIQGEKITAVLEVKSLAFINIRLNIRLYLHLPIVIYFFYV